MKIILGLVFLISLTANALIIPKTIKPIYILKSSASNTDTVYLNGKLFVGTELGTVEIFDVNTKKQIKKITLPQILNFFEEYYSPKVYSVDVTTDEKRILILSEGQEGYSSLFIYENEKLNKIISEKDKLIIKKAKFVSKNLILLALISDELILFDIKNKKQVYRKQISISPFSAFILSPDKRTVAVATEGGIVYLVDTKTGKLIKKIENTHVDKIFSIDYKDHKIITGGRDRRVYIHDLDKKISIRFNADFFVYAVGLSPSAQIGAYQLNEKGHIAVINLKTNKRIFTLKGHKSSLTKIMFIDEHNLVSTEESPRIYFWRLPQ